MSVPRRIWIILFAAARGWLCAAFLHILRGALGLAYLSRIHHFPMRWQYVFNDGTAFWLMCSAVVTLVVAAVLVMPLLAALRLETLLQKPLLIFLLPLLIIVPVSVLLSAAMRSQVDGLDRTFPIYGIFALVTCVLSSSFLLLDLRRWRQDQAGPAF